MTRRDLLEVVKFLSVALAFATVSFFTLVLWTSDAFGNADDPFTISIEFDCRQVTVNSTDVPEYVIDECMRIMHPTKFKDRTTGGRVI